MNIGSVIMSKRKALGYTQQTLADKLNVSFQAVSKWENGTNYPEMEILPMIASVLDTSIDSLLGYKSFVVSDYDKRYDTADYYWGITPNNLCYEIMKLRPPVKPLKVLDIGCGEGKKLAEKCNTYVDFFKADITDFRTTRYYDIIFSSGVFHFIKPEIRKEITANLKEYTNKSGIHAINAFVDKPFVEVPPDKDASRFRWKSGELFMLYHDCGKGKIIPLWKHCI